MHAKPKMARKTGSKQVSPERCQAIIDMKRNGLKHRVIADYYEMPISTISGIISRYRNKTSTKIIEKRGRKRKISKRSCRLLQNYVRNHRFMPLHALVAEFKKFTKIIVHVSTMRRCLHRLHLRNYRAVSKPFLSHKNIIARVQWAKKHELWTTAHWSKVAFSDESSFTVKPTSSTARVWRKPKDRYNLQCMVPTFKSGHVTISVWGAFSVRGRTPLVRIVGRLNQNTYKAIIEEQVMNFAKEKHKGLQNFILQEDNSRIHRAKSVASYMHQQGINRLLWPSQSPDLNPIENAWAILKRRLRERSTYPTGADALFDALSEEWEAIPQSYFICLSNSMASRVAAVRKSRGSSTKY